MRKLLNKLKWDKKYDFDKITVWYVSRGAKDDIGSVRGEDILKIGGSFLETKNGMIPYHRILRIEYEGKEINHKIFK